jgi:putative hemolysin
MNSIFLEVSLILALILLNGFFAAAEIAVVSARRGRLQALAAGGHPGARQALALQQDPGRFLSTVQIGITLGATLASVIGGASIVRFLEPRLKALPLPLPAVYVELAAVLLVVVAIWYFTMVLGELVPKEFALRRAVALAMSLSGPLDRLSRLVHPLVWVLTQSSGLVLRLVEIPFPTRGNAEGAVTDAEILAMLREGVATGAFHSAEQTLVQGVFNFADRQVQDVMKPRPEITAVPADKPLAQVLDLARQRGYSRFPVYEDDLDHIVGVVHIKELLLRCGDLQQPVREIAQEPLLVPGSLRLVELLRRFQQAGAHLAIVLDEFGGTAGMITLEDLLEEIVGSIEDEYAHPEPVLKRHANGRLTVPGTLSLPELAVLLGKTLPDFHPYTTVAGLILHRLGHIPQPGEEVMCEGHRLVVQEMKTRRITQVSIIAPSQGQEDRRGDRYTETT